MRKRNERYHILSPRATRIGLLVFVPLTVVFGVQAISWAVPKTWTHGDTLTATDLNGNFGALDQRLTALEGKEPFAGTYPAVLGLGTGQWFCGTAPATLNLTSAPLLSSNPFTSSNGFGRVMFTTGGAFSINLSLGWLTVGGVPPTSICPSTMCAGPVTFFLKSPTSQIITLHNFVDDAGSIYVDGVAVATGLGDQNSTNVSVPAGSFALSLIACSTNGPSLWVNVYDAFLTSPAYGLTIDYDRTFHRNGH